MSKAKERVKLEVIKPFFDKEARINFSKASLEKKRFIERDADRAEALIKAGVVKKAVQATTPTDPETPSATPTSGTDKK